MGVTSVHEEVQGYLRLSLRIEGRAGDCIEAGEEFKVRATVANMAPAHSKGPRIHFRNPRVVVSESAMARPAASSTLWLDLPESYLRPGEAASVDVELVALEDLSSLLQFVGGAESVVRAWATADLDVDALFRLWVSLDRAD